MKITLFIIAALLVITWILGFFVYNAGAMKHVFIILAGLSLMQGIILTPRTQTEDQAAI